MIGLTWGDPLLTLTPLQWGAVLSNGAAWLVQWRRQIDRRAVALLTCGLLGVAFWNVPVGRDTTLLFEQAGQLQPLTWRAFLAELPKRPYLEYQTPFYPFLVSRLPVVWWHQMYLLPLAVVNCLLLGAVFGDRAALLCATPLFGILQTQPGTDSVLFSLLLVSLRCLQLGARWAAAVVYGLAYLIKPLVIVTLPVMAGALGPWLLVALLIWAGYVGISLRSPFGQHQLAFLGHQLYLKQMAGMGRPRPDWQPSAFRWRWRTVTVPALSALPRYLFPAYLSLWRGAGLLLAAGILLGYGNIKYLLLVLLFVLPIQGMR
jgi:hypothetical protein